MKLNLKELAQAAGGTVIFGDPGLTAEHITTASGKINGSDLFVPIRGRKTDGHLYIGEAFRNGAAVSLTEEPETEAELQSFSGEKGLIRVASTQDALLRLGAWYRKERVRIPFVGITGSVGKTTTREMVSAALRAGLRVYSTKGNANSQIGVPITICETEPDAEVGVIELGISEFGEMEQISAAAAPDIALITNIGVSHMAQFGTQENILREKLKILSGTGREMTLYLNGDDPLLSALTEERLKEYGVVSDRRIHIVFFGTGENAFYRVTDLRMEEGYPCFTFTVEGLPEKTCEVRISVPGQHMVLNAAAALSVADGFGIMPKKAAEALRKFTGFEGRGNRIERDGYTLINDCYNASPASMTGGLKVLKELPAEGRKIAVLADMRELGTQEEELHRQIGSFIAAEFPGLSELYTYGELASLIGEEVGRSAGTASGRTKVMHYSDLSELKQDLFGDLRRGDLVLLKGSLSMGLRRLLE